MACPSVEGTNFTSSDYYGIVFRGTVDGVLYEWEAAYVGQSQTQFVNTVTVVPPTLGLSVTGPDRDATAGRPFSYTLRAGATVNATSGRLSLTSTLPATLSFTSANGTGWDCAASSGQNVSCSYADVVPVGGTAAPLELTVTPSASGSVQTSFTLSGGGAESSVTQQASAVKVNAALQAFSIFATLGFFAEIEQATNLSTSGGTAPYRWSVVPDLPEGLTLNADTGVVTGVATTPQDRKPYTFTAVDANGSSSSFGINILIYPPLSTSTAAVCSVTPGGLLTLLEKGTCTVAADQAGDATYLAAPTVTRSIEAQGESPAVQTELVKGLMQARAMATILGQPDLSGFLDGSDAGGADVTVSSMGGELDIARYGGPIWFRLSGHRTVNADQSGDHYAQLSFGSHRKLGDHAILGLMATLDSIRQTQAKGSAAGEGFMVGPYFVGRFGKGAMGVELRALTGLSRDRITELGLPESHVRGARSLIMAKLSRSWTSGDLTLTPSLGYAEVWQRSDSYLTPGGVAVPGTSAGYRQGTVALDFRLLQPTAAGLCTLTGGIGLFAGQMDGGASSAGLTYRLGVATRLAEGVDLTADLSGQSDLQNHSHSLGLAVKVQARF